MTFVSFRSDAEVTSGGRIAAALNSAAVLSFQIARFQAPQEARKVSEYNVEDYGAWNT